MIKAEYVGRERISIRLYGFSGNRRNRRRLKPEKSVRRIICGYVPGVDRRMITAGYAQNAVMMTARTMERHLAAFPLSDETRKTYVSSGDVLEEKIGKKQDKPILSGRSFKGWKRNLLLILAVAVLGLGLWGRGQGIWGRGRPSRRDRYGFGRGGQCA